jgi:transcriptional regulator with GAF, ATPase, and Fis domain
MAGPRFRRSDLVDPYDPESSCGKAKLRVLTLGDEGSRSQLISRIVTAGGAEAVPAASVSAADKLRSPECFAALVGLPASPDPDFFRLNEIRSLVDSGLLVMCYADGVRAWPLRSRCDVLLAGAFNLFDSASSNFADELNDLLSEVVRLQVGRRSEEARINAEMQRLGVIGESRTMRSIFCWVERISLLSDLPALITGETGTGKELIVNAVHRLDRKRSSGPLVALNCGAISAGVAESELFGHRRGAFTGAERQRKGLIRAADGGVLFLDEIGDLDLTLQSKLLRVLQENRVLAVGEEREVPISIRVIAATNRNLEQMVADGAFRDDLFHRLNILSVNIPPLRQRPADLRPLVLHFVDKHRDLCNGRELSVEDEFIEALAQLEMPGNVREVENIVRRALVNKLTGRSLGLNDLPIEVLRSVAAPRVNCASSDAEEQIAQVPFLPPGQPYDAALFRLLDLNQGSLARTLDECERLLITGALEFSKGNQSSAAKLLDITPRSVYNKLRKHGLR